MKILRYILTALLFTNITFSQDLEAKLNELIKPLLDGKKNMSMAVGLFDVNSETPRMFFFGKVSKEDPSKPNENTVYEIGSITKTFTTTMLVMLERDGKLKINDPVQNYLPEGTTIHNFSSTAPLKLYHLATQTSGLPRLPVNMVMNKDMDVNNPYKKYGEAELLNFANNYIPEYEPGTKYLYSNAGFGLLGYAMERASGKTYEELLKSYIADSLGMTMTSTIINTDMEKNLAKPYNEKGEPAFNWDFDVMEGAGAIKSNMSDMVKYLAFQMGKTEKMEYNEGLKLIQTRRFETDIPNTAIGLGWHISETMWDRTVIWHDGGTGGYRSFMGFIPETNTGVVVLSNQANDVTGTAMEILKYLNR